MSHPAPRYRLPPNILRTGSNPSSTLDSIAINISNPIREAEPSTPPPLSQTPSPLLTAPGLAAEIASGGGAAPLTAKKLETPNQETLFPPPALENQKMPMGYKRVPSLDAITARLAKSRSLSIDGSLIS